MPEPEKAAVAVCPPHHWFIETEYKAEGSIETWTCTLCKESKLVTRERTLEKPVWSIGKNNKPAPEPVPEPKLAEAEADEG